MTDRACAAQRAGRIAAGRIAAAGLLMTVGARAAAATTQPAVVDASTLTRKVMCGYQAWFNTPTDGSGRGWVHWGDGAGTGGRVTFEMWPDVSESDADELAPTAFKHADGTPAMLFSSYNPKTVARHFKWMQDYGIDGVFLQRFGGGLNDAGTMRHYTRVLENVRTSADRYGRAFGLMYDLSGMRSADLERVKSDWKRLTDEDKLTNDKQYIRHNGKPVIAIWGLGFDDGRDPLLDAGPDLIDFFKNDPKYGNNTVLIGVPTEWRTQDSPRVPHEKYLQTLLAADIIQPWSVGAYRTPEEAVRRAQRGWVQDMKWCAGHGKTFMPVVFPGFSWHNLKPHQNAPPDEIPRLDGRFLWTQYLQAKRIGCTMVYQSMFDEVDEGTAVFKITNDPPDGRGTNQFLTLKGLPSDFYLKLVGQGTRLINGRLRPEDQTLVAPAPGE